MTRDRWLKDPTSGLSEIVIRIPPFAARPRIRVPWDEFHLWLTGEPLSDERAAKSWAADTWE